MGRESRRAVELRERLLASELPWNRNAEQGAICALWLGPNEHAKRMARRAMGQHFFDPVHGWLWARTTYALLQRQVDFGNDLERAYWLRRERIVPKMKQVWQVSIVDVMSECLEWFWWHGDWYIDKVIEASKVRARIVMAEDKLIEAIEAGEDWRMRA